MGKILNKNNCILIFMLMTILISSFLVISEELDTGSPNYIPPTGEVKDIENSGGKIEDREILVNLDEITSGSKDYVEEPEEPEQEERKTRFRLYSGEKVELEGTLKESTDINQIRKTETTYGEGRKEVKIWSEQHIEEEITAYTDIPELTEGQKENVKIYWKNENKELPIKEFADLNNNGLYDRISWIVPHLSEQIFEIIIDFSTEESSENIEITINDVPDGLTNNPINFNFNISYDYLENIDCNLEISSTTSSFSDTKTLNIPPTPYQLTLPNGNYDWNLSCLDPINNKSESTEGSFTIAEGFSVLGSKRVYLLDGGGNLLNGEDQIQIHSEQSSEISIKIHKPSSLEDLTCSYNGTDCELTLNNIVLQEKGDYTLEVTFNRLANPISINKTFSVARANISIAEETIKTNEEISIRVEVDSPIEKITSIILDFGDGNPNIDYHNINDNYKDLTFTHSYLNAGDYTLKLTLIIDYTERFEITKNGFTVEESRDTEVPDIDLEYPNNDAIIREPKVDFGYNATDNIKLDNCTFELYNYSENFGALDYSVTHEGDDIGREIKLEEFEQGDYTWYIGCYDNSSNYKERGRDFTISLNESDEDDDEDNETPYEKKELLEELIRQINSFLEEKESSTLKEKEVMDDLQLSIDLNFYKKRLNQIDKDLSHNLKFIDDEELREQRKREMFDEIDETREKIPTDMEIVQEKEFVKNTITEDLSSIIEAYFESKNTKIEKSKLNILTELNYRLQNFIVVSTNVRHVELTYNDRVDEITLISKELTIQNETLNTILEIIPKSLASNSSDVTFLTDVEIIKHDPIFEISINDLESNKLIYYVDGFVDFSEVEKSETILFQEFSLEKVGITGFFVSDLDVKSSIYYSIIVSAIILIAYLLLVYSRKLTMKKWKEEENVVKILKLMKESKSSLNRKDHTAAKESYHQIKQLYPLIPEKCQKRFYKNIRKIRVAIDKKDIFDLAKEYKESKLQGRKEDATSVYKNIQATYKRLPKKYQKIIFNKIQGK